MFGFIKAFIAGFISTLTFHQGLLWIFRQAHIVVAATPWNMAPVPPFGVPAAISLAFWGGLWGVLLWGLIRRALAAGYYVGAILLGAIVPTAVTLTLIAWLRQQPIAGAFNGQLVGIALALNGAWGLGVALFMRLMAPPR